MADHMVLVFNMGHSGGRWFQDACNIHPDVQLWQEANHFLKIESMDSVRQHDIVYGFFLGQWKYNHNKTIGLIKSFDNRLIDLCEKNNGTIVQMFRNPIGIIEAKNGSKTKECFNRGVFKNINTEEQIFEAHVEFYLSRYLEYIGKKEKWPIIKLEDLNKSLKSDSLYFRDVLKGVLKVDFSDEHIEKIREMYKAEGRLSRAYSCHPDDSEIFNKWPEWKRIIFDKYFKDVMSSFAYLY